MKSILVAIIIISYGSTTFALDQDWGPWSITDEAPVILTQTDKEILRTETTHHNTYNLGSKPFVWFIRFYQNYISPLNGTRCPMYPSCSQYSLEAIQKHGPIVGIIMTADRLIHEYDEKHSAPLIKVGNYYRYSDPLENNDFWWYSK